jgi:hypothetical protein
MCGLLKLIRENSGTVERVKPFRFKYLWARSQAKLSLRGDKTDGRKINFCE